MISVHAAQFIGLVAPLPIVTQHFMGKKGTLRSNAFLKHIDLKAILCTN